MTRAFLVFAGGAALTSVFARVILEFEYSRANLWFGAFYAGHTVLALLLSRGRLRISLPVTLAWIDFFVVAGVPWVGPVAWYREWRRLKPTIWP